MDAGTLFHQSQTAVVDTWVCSQFPDEDSARWGTHSTDSF